MVLLILVYLFLDTKVLYTISGDKVPVLNIRKSTRLIYFWDLCWFSIGAVTTYHGFRGLNQHTFNILEFYRLEFWDRCHWAKITVLAGCIASWRLQEGIRFLVFFFQFQGLSHSLAQGPLPLTSKPLHLWPFFDWLHQRKIHRIRLATLDSTA